MAEFLASSAAMTGENSIVASKSSQDNPAIVLSEPTSIDSPRTNSSLLHRRIVTMLDTLKTASDDPSAALSSTLSQTEHSSQPITFGQLRQATIGSSASSSSTLNPTKSNPSPSKKLDTEEKPMSTLLPYPRENAPDVPPTSMAKYQINKGKFYYSPSLEQLFEEQNRLAQTKKVDEQTQISSLTVDDILAKHYSKLHLSTNSESHLPSSTQSNTSSGFYIHPSGPRWDTLQNNPPSLLLNEQNRNRPPPPPYLSGTTTSHRTSSTGMFNIEKITLSSFFVITLVSNPNEHLFHSSMSSSSLLDQLYPGSSAIQHLSTDNSLSSFIPVTSHAMADSSTHPRPPRYQSPTSKAEQSHSTSSQKSKLITTTNPIQPSSGFDREFSRLLYGKEPVKTRRQKSKRKAFSDPDKYELKEIHSILRNNSVCFFLPNRKSVEEAKRTLEKVRRRLTTHFNKTDKVQEKDDDETETESESCKTPKQDLTPLQRRRSYRQSE